MARNNKQRPKPDVIENEKLPNPRHGEKSAVARKTNNGRQDLFLHQTAVEASGGGA